MPKKEKVKKPKKKSPLPYQALFTGYEGHVLWDVRHPDYKKPVRVCAPVRGCKEGQAAIVAAAEHWGRRWQEYSFYAQCTAQRI